MSKEFFIYSIFGAFKQATVLYTRNWKTIFPFIVLLMVISLIGNWYLSTFDPIFLNYTLFQQALSDGSFHLSLTTTIYFAISITIVISILFGITYQMDNVMQNANIQWFVALKHGVKKIIPFLAASLLISLICLLLTILIVMLGIVFFLVISFVKGTTPSLQAFEAAGPIMSVVFAIGLGLLVSKWILYPLALCLDDKTAFQSLKYSYQLNRGCRNTIGTITMFIVIFLIGLIFSFLIEFLFMDSYENIIFSGFIYSLLNGLLLSWQISCWVCWYRNLQNRMSTVKTISALNTN